MILVSLLGMSPTAVFAIMVGVVRLPDAVGSLRFIRELGTACEARSLWRLAVYPP
jgi:hypothetical protein